MSEGQNTRPPRVTGIRSGSSDPPKCLPLYITYVQTRGGLVLLAMTEQPDLNLASRVSLRTRQNVRDDGFWAAQHGTLDTAVPWEHGHYVVWAWHRRPPRQCPGPDYGTRMPRHEDAREMWVVARKEKGWRNQGAGGSKRARGLWRSLIFSQSAHERANYPRPGKMPQKEQGRFPEHKGLQTVSIPNRDEKSQHQGIRLARPHDPKIKRLLGLPNRTKSNLDRLSVQVTYLQMRTKLQNT